MRTIFWTFWVLPACAQLRVGYARVDVTPTEFPVIVNCGFLERSAAKAQMPLYASALVLDDGKTRLSIAIVDSCMLPRELLDEAKELASSKTAIPVNRMLIAATHSHSAPAAMACLGSDAQPGYHAFLVPRIAQAIADAGARLQPAIAGFASIDDFKHTHNRRWIYRSDKMLTDPFGLRSVRANMHPGYQNPDAIGPSGPVDPQLSVVAFATPDRRPIALLANYSQHYFGAPPLHPDYAGLFVDKFSDFPAIFSQGTSGDLMWMDYSQPKPSTTLDEYATGVAESARGAFRKIQYSAGTTLAMAETIVAFRRRTPDPQRVAWAREVLAKMGNRKPANQPEVYAREAVLLHEEPYRQLKLQAVRIGDTAIAAFPNEVFAITGLRLKALSPLANTFNIELANGAEGYIPPPDQHKLGGYTTWPARTAALAEDTEPRIVAALLSLLEKVSGKRKRTAPQPTSAAILREKPMAYWPLDEFHSPTARDAVGRNHALYQGGVAFHLAGHQHRAVQLAGGHITAHLRLREEFTISLWAWAGGVGLPPLRINAGTVTGLKPKTWQHVAIVRTPQAQKLYIDAQLVNQAKPEPAPSVLQFGPGFEGKLDEIAVFPRALAQEQIHLLSQ